MATVTHKAERRASALRRLMDVAEAAAARFGLDLAPPAPVRDPDVQQTALLEFAAATLEGVLAAAPAPLPEPEQPEEGADGNKGETGQPPDQEAGQPEETTGAAEDGADRADSTDSTDSADNAADDRMDGAPAPAKEPTGAAKAPKARK